VVVGAKEKSLRRNSDTKMHRQVHRTDVVPELAGRQSMSLVARSKKTKIAPQLYMSPIHM